MPTIFIALHFALLSMIPAAPIAEPPHAQAPPPATQLEAPREPQSESRPADDEPPMQDDDNDEPAPDIVPVDDELDALLDKLEANAQDLETFTADITYRKLDDLLGRRETRTGEIIFVSQPVEGVPGAFLRKFGIIFHTLIVNSRKDQYEKHYIFDGRWLAEIDKQRKVFIAREIVPPGETLDPLKLGEGPFPLPIGQQKSEVLQRFVVERTEPPIGGLLGGLENVTGIMLIPRVGTPQAEEFRTVEVFYDNDTLLPVGIEAVATNGDRKTVRLRNVKRNPELTDQQRADITITQPDPEQWMIDKRPWQADN